MPTSQETNTRKNNAATYWLFKKANMKNFPKQMAFLQNYLELAINMNLLKPWICLYQYKGEPEVELKQNREDI